MFDDDETIKILEDIIFNRLIKNGSFDLNNLLNISEHENKYHLGILGLFNKMIKEKNNKTEFIGLKTSIFSDNDFDEYIEKYLNITKN